MSRSTRFLKLRTPSQRKQKRRVTQKRHKNKPKPRRPKRRTVASKRRGYLPGVARTLGATIGGHFGGPLGGALGGKLGSLFGSISGLGSYDVKHNTLLTDNGPPVFSSNGKTRIVHREFISNVVSSNTFRGAVYPINPGLPLTFPWLSGIAANFEQYQLEGIVFEYKSTSADALNSTNTALGTVVLSTNYDVMDPPFTSKREMEAYEYTVSTAPSASVIHPIECGRGRNTLDLLYIDPSGIVVEGTDRRFHDHGNLTVACEGMQQSDVVIGELWVSYHIDLVKPKLPANPNSGEYHLVSTPGVTDLFTDPHPYLTNTLDVHHDGINELFLPSPGNYIATAIYQTTTSVNPFSFFAGAHCIDGPYTYFFSNTSPKIGCFDTTTLGGHVRRTEMYVFTITSDSLPYTGSITISVPTFVGVTSLEIIIHRLPNNIIRPALHEKPRGIDPRLKPTETPPPKPPMTCWTKEEKTTPSVHTLSGEPVRVDVDNVQSLPVLPPKPSVTTGGAPPQWELIRR